MGGPMPAFYYVANKALLINPQGMVLAVRDAGQGEHANMRAHWDLPGGRMEENETPFEGLRREIREEVGIEIDPTQAKPFHIGKWGPAQFKVIGIIYVVTVGDAHIQLSDEHDEYRWLDPRKPLPEEIEREIGHVVDQYRTLAGIARPM